MEESKKFFLLKKVFVNGDSQQMVVLQPFFLQIPLAKNLVNFLISISRLHDVWKLQKKSHAT